MMSCRTAEFLFDVVPSRRFRDSLIRRHMERCAICQARLASSAEARPLFVAPEDLAGADNLWKRLKNQTGVGNLASEPARDEERSRAGYGLRWEWAAGAAAILVTAAVSLWLMHGTQATAVRVDSVRPLDRFEINYINVGGAPAQAFIYRPQGSDMIVVWAEKTP